MPITSFGFYFAYMWYSDSKTQEMEHAVQNAHLSPLFYLIIFLCAGVCFLIDYFAESFQFLYNPTPSQYLRYFAKNQEQPQQKLDKFMEICESQKATQLKADINTEGYL
jgi:hypothetical protein